MFKVFKNSETFTQKLKTVEKNDGISKKEWFIRKALIGEQLKICMKKNDSIEYTNV